MSVKIRLFVCAGANEKTRCVGAKTCRVRQPIELPKLSAGGKVSKEKGYGFLILLVLQSDAMNRGDARSRETVKCRVTLTEKGHAANTQRCIANFFGTRLEPTWAFTGGSAP